jgi:uncharacterized protein YjlB
MAAETHWFEDDGGIPDSPLPVLVYHDVAEAHDAASCEAALFARNRWLGAWRDGIFSFHHFHSTAHEVLGIVAGQAAVVLGGPRGVALRWAPETCSSCRPAPATAALVQASTCW